MTAALFQEQPKVGGSKSPEQGKCLLMNEKKAKHNFGCHNSSKVRVNGKSHVTWKVPQKLSIG